MTGGIWDILGIAATDDARAIRAAYAQRLKTIDVDGDARGFIALRSAYEAARAGRTVAVETGSWVETAPAPVDPVAEDEHQADTPAAEPDIVLREIGALHRMFEYVANQQRRWLSAEEKLELRRGWSAIAAEAERSDIARYGDAEARVRWLILHWGTLAVGLVPFAVEFFHWDRHEGGFAEDGSVAEIMWRYQAIQFLQCVRRPDHSHHPAWRELTSKYFPGSGRGRCDPSLVHELQAVVRHVWPELEAEFDPGRVAIWRNNTADPTHPENPNAPMPARVVRALKIAGALMLLYMIVSVLLPLLAR